MMHDPINIRFLICIQEMICSNLDVYTDDTEGFHIYPQSFRATLGQCPK